MKAEYATDWDKARALVGPDATIADLPCTHAQRRADALAQIIRDAAVSKTSAVSVPTHTIVWTSQTYETMLALLETETETTPDFDIDTYRCSTVDGIPLDPIEAVLSSLVSRVQRVVGDAARVVIEQGAARSAFARSCPWWWR